MAAVGYILHYVVFVDQFRATGDGWQTRMDAALKDWLKTHSPA